MLRKEGFIDVLNLLKLPNIEINDLKTMAIYLLKNNPSVIIRKLNKNQLIFSFEYQNETYYYKFDAYVPPYNELLFYFIANDLGIESLKYDLALLGNFKGTISKNFKITHAKYIAGSKILKKFHSQTDYFTYNTLEDIWIELELYYKEREDMQEIIQKIMSKLVKIFIFDIIIGQEDRHCNNWGIIEYDNGNIDLQILIDNSRALVHHPLNINCLMPLNQTKMNLEEMILKFQEESSEEFSSLLSSSLWVISKENLSKIFAKIENLAGSPIPPKLKDIYIARFEIYYEFLNKVIFYPSHIRSK